jgi:hypothetical protein
MKKYWTILSIILTAFCFHSCEKETENTKQSDEMLFYEQAYPETTGDTVRVTLNGELIVCEFINGEYVFQGDIIIKVDTKEQVKGAALSATSKRWPQKTIYYTIDEDFTRKGTITEAIKHWQDNTDITFVERTNENNYIEFIETKRNNSSYLGMIGGKQRIRISEGSEAGTVIHEIGHAIGLIHEHSRNDRDNYVIIKWKNIRPLKAHNFFKVEKSTNTESFDFESIMLYGSWGFAIDGKKPTITRTDGLPYFAQREKLSSGDIEIINQIYSNNIDYSLTDDFETYDVGSFPSEGNWAIKYNGAGNQYQYITDGYSYSGSQSFRLQGAPSWSARIVNQLPETPDIVYFETSFYSESVEHEGSFGLRNPNVGTWGTGISVCRFIDGYISVNGYDLSEYIPQQWYKVKVLTNLTDQTFSAWLDDDIIIENQAFDYTDVDYTHFYLDATNDGTNIVFYDDVRVWKD